MLLFSKSKRNKQLFHPNLLNVSFKFGVKNKILTYNILFLSSKPQPHIFLKMSYGQPQPYGYGYGQPTPNVAQPQQSYGQQSYGQQPYGYGQPQPAPQVMPSAPYSSPYPPTNQPTYVQPVQPVQPVTNSNTSNEHLHDWNSGLCSFCEDFGVCFGTMLCCPCETLATRKVAFDKDELTCCEKLSCIPMCATTYIGLCLCEACCECKNRSRLKERLHFKDTSSECCKTLLCMPCVVCQHQREIKFRKKMGMFQEK
jgi:Cys-rich protein (TIGR01571 family)